MTFEIHIELSMKSTVSLDLKLCSLIPTMQRFYNLKRVIACSYETLINIHDTICSYIPEYRNP
jgi:hypothetical protein